jgi:hypothetical protein
MRLVQPIHGPERRELESRRDGGSPREASAAEAQESESRARRDGGPA